VIPKNYVFKNSQNENIFVCNESSEQNTFFVHKLVIIFAIFNVFLRQLVELHFIMDIVIKAMIE